MQITGGNWLRLRRVCAQRARSKWLKRNNASAGIRPTTRQPCSPKALNRAGTSNAEHQHAKADAAGHAANHQARFKSGTGRQQRHHGLQTQGSTNAASPSGHDYPENSPQIPALQIPDATVACQTGFEALGPKRAAAQAAARNEAHIAQGRHCALRCPPA